MKRTGKALWTILLLLIVLNYYLLYQNIFPLLQPPAPRDYVLHGADKIAFNKLQGKHGYVTVKGWPERPVFYRNGKWCSYK